MQIQKRMIGDHTVKVILKDLYGAQSETTFKVGFTSDTNVYEDAILNKIEAQDEDAKKVASAIVEKQILTASFESLDQFG